MSWKKAVGHVTGYKIYCFPADSLMTEITEDIDNADQQSVIISGLKPETVYRVGITSVSEGKQSKIQFSENDVKLRKL